MRKNEIICFSEPNLKKIFVSNMASSSVVSWVVVALLAALYGVCRHLFKKARLPLPFARVWGRVHFAVWLQVLRLLTRYWGYRKRPWAEISPGVWLGKCPLEQHVPLLLQLGVRRVLNLQDEYAGPVEAYRAAGIEQLRIPVVDHYEPTPEQIEMGVSFIERSLEEGKGVYCHCQGGHGRSAAIVFALMVHQSGEHHEPTSRERINKHLSGRWRVREKLHSQVSIMHFLKKRAAEIEPSLPKEGD